MSTHPISSATDERLSADSDLTQALVSLDQARRVAELAHTGVTSILATLPPGTFVEDIVQKAEDSLVLFGLALRLVDERNQEFISLTQRLIAA